MLLRVASLERKTNTSKPYGRTERGQKRVRFSLCSPHLGRSRRLPEGSLLRRAVRCANTKEVEMVATALTDGGLKGGPHSCAVAKTRSLRGTVE
ncbi:hypothetical protein DPEC_G00291650 [Dallia pectoralis]|uniref:Uncharacterized protein n=1 Tax=Dallia pectoralis TaxID=75939 RepID=A0ACC2FHN9_DALPE|nr:hypothetical protein DPEC_G00291650 [Dallia pectoralis]